VLAEDVGSIPANVTRIIKRVYSEAGRLQRLSNTLLDIDKMEDGKLDIETSPVSCSEIIRVSIDAVRAQFERKKVVIDFTGEQELFCLCERDRTIQVLVNLLSNAVKFSDVNSKIEVTCKLMQDGKAVRFEVLDEGSGVPDEKAGSLFNKFTQLEQPEDLKKQGSGLGLYICKMLVDAQDGAVGYIKRQERGSCFWFELPAVAWSKRDSIEAASQST
jgi:K+-sensing histidine kinase KdpD